MKLTKMNTDTLEQNSERNNPLAGNKQIAVDGKNSKMGKPEMDLRMLQCPCKHERNMLGLWEKHQEHRQEKSRLQPRGNHKKRNSANCQKAKMKKSTRARWNPHGVLQGTQRHQPGENCRNS